ncbi:MAG: AAA family ATPase, partial [Ignavibacteriaceae bacterium]|nr:AAA family ATPase [Ignavibacteriaceae bacterium]
MTKKKIPYGISNFEAIKEDNYYYVDKTKYLELLEGLNEKYLFFLRPRKFGKSLFISLLEYYYGINHKDKFEKLFGEYYIGNNPTPKANSYYTVSYTHL